MVHHPTKRGYRGRRRTRLVGGGETDTVPTIRQQRLADDTPVPEGYTKCPECGRVIKDRADGTSRAHRSQGTIPCIAAQPR